MSVRPFKDVKVPCVCATARAGPHLLKPGFFRQRRSAYAKHGFAEPWVHGNAGIAKHSFLVNFVARKVLSVDGNVTRKLILDSQVDDAASCKEEENMASEWVG